MERSNVKCPVCGYVNEGVAWRKPKGGLNAASARPSLWHRTIRNVYLAKSLR